MALCCAENRTAVSEFCSTRIQLAMCGKNCRSIEYTAIKSRELESFGVVAH